MRKISTAAEYHAALTVVIEFVTARAGVPPTVAETVRSVAYMTRQGGLDNSVKVTDSVVREIVDAAVDEGLLRTSGSSRRLEINKDHTCQHDEIVDAVLTRVARTSTHLYGDADFGHWPVESAGTTPTPDTVLDAVLEFLASQGTVPPTMAETARTVTYILREESPTIDAALTDLTARHIISVAVEKGLLRRRGTSSRVELNDPTRRAATLDEFTHRGQEDKE